MAERRGYDPMKLRNRNQNRSTVMGRHGMVAASQPLATVAGLRVLFDGGNCVDAAVAANAMIALTEPMSCGPGGDLFAILWHERDRKLYGLNASGRAPYAWSIEEAKRRGVMRIPSRGPLTWSVPGCVSGWDMLLARFGTKPLSELLAPAIETAREGFPVSPIIASQWVFSPNLSPTMAETYLVDGAAPGYGGIYQNPRLAAFYEILAREGAQAFYQGEIAERIVKFSTDNGGYFSMRDFEAHESNWLDPVHASYRGYDLWELPPNGQGIAALQILNMLEQFDIGSLEPNSAEQLHLFIEAKKLAYEDRAIFYADPEKADVPVEALISKAYAAERAKLIDPARAMQEVKAGMPESHSDTIYLVAADSEGNMISFIQSIYGAWGSNMAPGELGFCLQNRGAAFDLDPEARNALEPHKRPFHTIIPAFVTKDGAPKFAFGVMGGDFQPQGHAQVMMNLVDYDMSPQQAGEQPRAEHSGSSEPDGTPARDAGFVQLEAHFDPKAPAQLEAMGHRVRAGSGAFGGYQGIWREDGPLRYFGGSDPRKDGMAIGY